MRTEARRARPRPAARTAIPALSCWASRRADEPGQHEWWNFFAQDEATGVGVSTIFLNGNMFDVDYQSAWDAYREDPGSVPAPLPSDYILLQLNVSKDDKKVFTSIKLPPETTWEFSRDRPYGRIGDSWFEAVEEGGEIVWRVHIDSPDMFNWLRLEADLEYRDAARAFTVADGGFFGPVPGGGESGIHFFVARPVVRGHVRIRDRFGKVSLDQDISGGGHCDHVFGRFYSDLVRSYYFGRLEQRLDGDLAYFYHFPRQPEVPAYGWLVRIPGKPGMRPRAYAVTSLAEEAPARGDFGLDYYAEIEMQLAGGGFVRTFMERTAASEDWPFQITGAGHFDVDVPGDVRAQGAIGLAEYGYFDGLKDPLFRFLSSLLKFIPWLP